MAIEPILPLGMWAFREQFLDWLGRFCRPVPPVCGLRAAVYSGGSGSRSTANGPVGLVRGIVARPEPDQGCPITFDESRSGDTAMSRCHVIGRWFSVTH